MSAMNDEQIERLLDALELLASGVDSIGDGIKSIATYLWFPIYVLVIGIFLVISVYLYVSFG